MNKNAKNLTATVCLTLGLLLSLQTVLAESKNYNALNPTEPVISPPPQANKHGKTYAEWAASWWTWALETPVVLPDSHPGFDQGSVDCSIGQDGHVWFLAGKIFFVGEVSRSCTVPTGTAFFFPLYNNVYINFATDPPLTSEFCEALTQNTVQSLGNVTITALLDGKPLNDKQTRFEQSLIFSAQMPPPTATETNLMAYFGYGETEFPNWVASANCDFGWYGYVPPLSPGRHTLEWKVESSMQGLLQDVSYDLTVLPRNR